MEFLSPVNKNNIATDSKEVQGHLLLALKKKSRRKTVNHSSCPEEEDGEGNGGSKFKLNQHEGQPYGRKQPHDGQGSSEERVKARALLPESCLGERWKGKESCASLGPSERWALSECHGYSTALCGAAQAWGFWRGKARYPIRGAIIPLMSLEALRWPGLIRGWSLHQVIDLPNWNVGYPPRPFSRYEENGFLLIGLSAMATESVLRGFLPG